MAIRTVILMIMCLLVALFLALNWAGVMAPVPVNLLVVETQAPLGFILLLVFGLLFILVLLWALLKQASLLTEVRKINKAAIADRDLAQDAEKSRFEELRKALTQAVESLGKDSSEKMTAFLAEQKKSRDDLSAQIEMLRKSVDRLNSLVQIVSRGDLPPMPTTPGKSKQQADEVAVASAAALAAMQPEEKLETVQKDEDLPATESETKASQAQETSQEDNTKAKKGFFSSLFKGNKKTQ